jgi:hypothetical protein
VEVGIDVVTVDDGAEVGTEVAVDVGCAVGCVVGGDVVVVVSLPQPLKSKTPIKMIDRETSNNFFILFSLI